MGLLDYFVKFPALFLASSKTSAWEEKDLTIASYLSCTEAHDNIVGTF